MYKVCKLTEFRMARCKYAKRQDKKLDLGKHLRIKKRHRPKKNRRDKINNTNQIHLNKGKKSVEDPKNKKISLQIF